MRNQLTAAAVGVALALTGGGIAHATTTPVTIAMSNAITTCDGTNAEITAILHNDGGPDEDVQTYLEPNSGVGGLGVPVQYNQPAPDVIHIPSGAQAVVHLPYENGSAVFNAIAVAHGAALPTSTTDLENQVAAKTAAFSELFPAGNGTHTYTYPVAPSGCTPPPWHPCPPNWPIDLYPVVQTCPVWTPPPAPTVPAQPKASSAAPPKPVVKATTHPSTTTTSTPAPAAPSVTTSTTTKAVVPQVEAATVAPSTSASTTASVSVTTEPSSVTIAPAAVEKKSSFSGPLLLVGLALAFGAVAVVCAVVGARRKHRHN